MKHRRSLRLGAALTTALVAGAMLATPAHASSTGKVSGTLNAVNATDGGFVVAIWPASSKPVTFVHEPPKYVELGQDGHYSLSGVAPGKYIVGAADFSKTFGYTFYRSQSLSSNARTVTVTAGHTTGDINLTIHHTALIDATVQNTAGVGIGAVHVDVYDADGVVAGFNNENETDSGGVLQIAGIPSGSYRFKLSGPGIPTQWANGVSSSAAAKSTTVTTAQHLTGVVLTARANPAITSTARPTISGTLTKGHTLTAHNGGWATTPTSFTYRWLRDGRSIGGATAKTYKLTSSDVGKHISVRVGAVAPDTVTSIRTSSRTAKIRS